ncbi:urease accessory protein UreE [uncultured Thiothrix sp.]|uniref:urease accessory protein UreE n=1 Tax=uncultured Thiothrix sp. TaxID=223185 RepID=UPI0026123C58|nr:urease accessory protein UreE [uncultured Thiothrix sp.]HMT93514.1 urease accessory protein UreE [Thiolinea sp.]
MLKLIEVLAAQTSDVPKHTLTLPYERRIVSRQKVTLDQGEDAGLFLVRGVSLQHGDLLKAENGDLVQVQAALETVSSLYCTDRLLFARACYHLGNRHVPLEIRDGRLRYLHDHVLDAMLLGLGLQVVVEQARFEPEAGAYAPSGHDHSHRHNTHSHHHD